MKAYDEAWARATARASPLDYSRFEKIDVSDDEEPPRVEQPYAARSIEFCHPSTWKPPRAPVARASDVSHPSSWGGGHGPSTWLSWFLNLTRRSTFKLHLDFTKVTRAREPRPSKVN